MSKEQTEELENCLMDFVKRVSKGDATTDAEVQVLPAVAQVLVNINRG